MLNQVKIPVMWGIQQASVESGLTEFTLRQLVKAGHIRYIRLGAGKNGKILINAESLCAYMSGTTNESDNTKPESGGIHPIPVNL